MTPSSNIIATEAKQIARALSAGRRISRNGDGWKTYCPICDLNNLRRKSRATLSLTVRRGQVLVFCHRCRSDGVMILRELVRRGLLPNNFRESSMALELVDKVRAAAQTATWKGTAALTDLVVLLILMEIARRSLKADFNASVRQIGLQARRHECTVSRSLRRLVQAGWLERVTRARDKRAAIWRLRIPPDRADRGATIQHAEKAGDCLLQIDPCFAQGDRAGSSRSAPFFDHDVFRWGKGLGLAKARIYALLTARMKAGPMTSNEIAKALAYKYSRNVTLHLQVLAKERLVHRLKDGRYELGDVDPEAVSARLGVLGASDKQRARYSAERMQWHRLSDAFEHWRQTGEIIDPETSEILETQCIPGERVKMRAFRYRVLSFRAARLEITEAPQRSLSTTTSQTPNLTRDQSLVADHY